MKAKQRRDLKELIDALEAAGCPRGQHGDYNGLLTSTNIQRLIKIKSNRTSYLSRISAIHVLSSELGYPYSEVTQCLYALILQPINGSDWDSDELFEKLFAELLSSLKLLKDNHFELNERTREFYETAFKKDVARQVFPVYIELLHAGFDVESHANMYRSYLQGFVDTYDHELRQLIADLGIPADQVSQMYKMITIQQNRFMQRFTEAEYPILTSYAFSLIKELFSSLRALNFRYTEATKLMFSDVLENLDELYDEGWGDFLLCLEEANFLFNDDTKKIYAASIKCPGIFDRLRELGFDISKPLHQELFFKLAEYEYVFAEQIRSYPPTTDAILFGFLRRVLLEKKVKIDRDDVLLATHDPKKQNALIEQIFEIKILNFKSENLEVLYSVIKDVGAYLEKERILTELEYGPLNKTSSTERLEKLFKTLVKCAQHGNHVLFQENALGECELIIDDTYSVNITVLLKNANLTHLKLGDSLIEKMGEVLNQLRPENYRNYKKTMPTGVGALAKLHPVLKQAISSMASPWNNYINMNVNALCRGYQLHKLDYVDKDISYSSNAFFTLLTLGLTAEALNRLPGLLSEPAVYPKEKLIVKKLTQFHLRSIHTALEYEQLLTQAKRDKTITGVEYRLMQGRYEELHALVGSPRLYRNENTGGLDPSIVEGRQLGVMQSTAPISTTILPDLDYYDGDLNIQFINSLACYPFNSSLSCDPDEKEILLPSSQIIYQNTSDREMTATIIASPAYQRDEYWIDHALRYCYLEHLNKEYSHISDRMEIGDRVVYRPNHGLAHAYRVMLFVAPVMEYFACYAEDEKLRKFCTNVSDINRQYLKIMAIFRTSGRESEIRGSANPEWYHGYKKQSYRNFCQYVEKFPLCLGINARTKAGQKELDALHQNEFNRAILEMAHNLDMLRCCSAESYPSLIQRTAVIATPEQGVAFNKLITYAMQLTGIHGNYVDIRFNDQNELENTEGDYDEDYGELSNNPQKLQQISAIVPAPHFVQPAQMEVLNQAKVSAEGLFKPKKLKQILKHGNDDECEDDAGPSFTPKRLKNH